MDRSAPVGHRGTRFGRHILAVGGNVEAARRAGISVSGIRLAVFAIASTLAALGGVVAAARLLAVNQNSGGGDLLLNSIAAAVIGGTSLFGGRGTVWAAFLGALVIGSISNGMDLLGYVDQIHGHGWRVAAGRHRGCAQPAQPSSARACIAGSAWQSPQPPRLPRRAAAPATA